MVDAKLTILFWYPGNKAHVFLIYSHKKLILETYWSYLLFLEMAALSQSRDFLMQSIIFSHASAQSLHISSGNPRSAALVLSLSTY